MNERLARVIKLYEGAGKIESIEGGGAKTASVCLDRAKERLAAAESLLADEYFESAYTTAYEYFDPSNPAGKTREDAQWATGQARRACEAVSSLL